MAKQRYHSLSMKLCQSIIAFSLVIFYLGCFQNSQAQVVWEEIPTPEGTYYSLAIGTDGTIYLGASTDSFRTGGVYSSNDGGITWEHIGLDGKSIHSLGFNHSGNLLAGADNGLYRLNDNQTWEMVLASIKNIISIEKGTYPAVFCAGGFIYKSPDDAATWSEVFFLEEKMARDFAIKSIDTIYLATTDIYAPEGGVFMSTDEGITWQNIGLNEFFVSTVSLNSKGDLFAGSLGSMSGYAGLQELKAGTDDWDTLFTWPRVSSTVVTNEDAIYCGLMDATEFHGGVIHSVDHGETWIYDTAGLADHSISELVLDNNEILYARSHWIYSKLFRSALPVSLKEQNSIIVEPAVYCYPNPFSNRSKFNFNISIPNKTHLVFAVYSSKGKQVFIRNLDLTIIANGSFTFYRRNLVPGIYYYSLSGTGLLSTGKFLITQ